MKFNVKNFPRRSVLLGLGLLSIVFGTSACQTQQNIFSNSEQNSSVTENMAPFPRDADTEPNSPPNDSSDRTEVTVFFPATPSENGAIDAVEPVSRTTDRVDVAEFAIEQLIAGPTSKEREMGLRDEIELTGESNCGGENFTLSISDAGEARLQFCRDVITAGIGQDARIINAIASTLKQFSTVDRVIILDASGNCFKDLSGENRCLLNE